MWCNGVNGTQTRLADGASAPHAIGVGRCLAPQLGNEPATMKPPVFFRMQRVRVILGAGFGAALLALGSMGATRADASGPRPMSLSPFAEPAAAARPMPPVVPEATPAPTRAELFADQLAALAAELRRAHPPAIAPLPAFDSEALF